MLKAVAAPATSSEASVRSLYCDRNRSSVPALETCAGPRDVLRSDKEDGHEGPRHAAQCSGRERTGCSSSSVEPRQKRVDQAPGGERLILGNEVIGSFEYSQPRG